MKLQYVEDMLSLSIQKISIGKATELTIQKKSTLLLIFFSFLILKYIFFFANVWLIM